MIYIGVQQHSGEAASTPSPTKRYKMKASRKREIRAFIEELEGFMAADKDDTRGAYCPRPDGLPGVFLAKRDDMVEMISMLRYMLPVGDR